MIFRKSTDWSNG